MTPDALVRKIMAGDVTAVSQLRSVTPEELSPATRGHTYTVRADVVASVLTKYVDGEISLESAQSWASFVRWGHLPSSTSEPSEAFDIEYEDTNT